MAGAATGKASGTEHHPLQKDMPIQGNQRLVTTDPGIAVFCTDHVRDSVSLLEAEGDIRHLKFLSPPWTAHPCHSSTAIPYEDMLSVWKAF